jgi:hypothetical protein
VLLTGNAVVDSTTVETKAGARIIYLRRTIEQEVWCAAGVSAVDQGRRRRAQPYWCQPPSELLASRCIVSSCLLDAVLLQRKLPVAAIKHLFLCDWSAGLSTASPFSSNKNRNDAFAPE